MNNIRKQQSVCNPCILESLDELVLKLHEHSNHIKCMVSDSCTLVMLRWWWVGIFLTSQRQWWILCRSFYSQKLRTVLERQPTCGGSQLHFTIYNALCAPLLCKRGMLKRILSLRNGIPAAPPPPHGHECCWRCSAAHWRKIPSTPILLS